jgi:signal transduction histidine kinase
MDLLGGEIQVASRLEEGSIFKVRLPLTPPRDRGTVQETPEEEKP